MSAEPPARRLRIAVFDYRVVPTNPIGGCHLRMLSEMCGEHEFTVFAVEFDNPAPDRIEFVRVPAPRRPLALLFIAYHLIAPIVYAVYRARGGRAFDVVQGVESNLIGADVSYAQFCHRAYLRRWWGATPSHGVRGALRWIDHRLHSLIEPFVFTRARRVVVPSRGLASELTTEYPRVQSKIVVIANPIDCERLTPTTPGERVRVRAECGVRPDQLMLVFTALGHFERKGLPLLLDAFAVLEPGTVRLVVVGGAPDLVAQYRRRAQRAGVESRVAFTGMTGDVRPFLWAADGFVFPSCYEAFSLAILEAAAAGLPVLAPPLNGLEEFLRDGENGILIERSAAGIADGIRRFAALSAAQRDAMGRSAAAAVRCYSPARFANDWRAFYGELTHLA